ncbi:hypothetical protein Y032_0254g285 [Ancylostoma ceylanicum]|uniref:Uncharacterized protein n=1 Tax=Ancylostoma ceylanicum TaxID=53326 RepID=A0A016SC51_9BILA|nr:hypothetical protein Y032_0254g285 [Ancylostoma ceylanicum]
MYTAYVGCGRIRNAPKEKDLLGHTATVCFNISQNIEVKKKTFLSCCRVEQRKCRNGSGYSSDHLNSPRKHRNSSVT